MFVCVGLRVSGGGGRGGRGGRVGTQIDGLRFYVRFNSISVIPIRRVGDNNSRLALSLLVY